MLINYLKISYRNLLNNKGFSFIQIAGLAIGVSITLVIIMLVKHEFSYDVFHKNGNRVYRIVSESRFNDEVFPNSGVPAPLAEAVEKEISGLETVVAFHIWEHVKVSVLQDGKVVKSIKPVNDIIFTSPDYFHLFSFEWLAGSPIQSLSESY